MKEINLKKPKKSNDNWDLRDVVPIIINCNLKAHQVYKIADAGIDLHDNKDKIIELSTQLNVDSIIATLKPKHGQLKT